MTPEQKNIMHIAFAILVAVPAMLFWSVVLVVVLGIFSLLNNAEEKPCNVARIPIKGVLTTTDDGISELFGFGAIVSADSIIEKLNSAEKNEDIDAVILDIDSPGGTPVSADEIMTALSLIEKPTVSVMRDRGTSAAYWVAAGTDYIIASPISDVGSVGVTMSYTEFASSSEDAGSRWIDLSSGAFKDAGNPERALREEEEEYFQSQVNTIHEYMVDRISSARKVISRDELATLADGRAFLGVEALELKLIDMLGGFDEAKTYLAQVLSVDESAVTLCPSGGSGLGDLLLD
jgi:protease-4